MTTAEGDHDREDENHPTERPVPPADTSTRLRQSGAAIAEAQAWKGEQIAKGFRKLVSALRRPRGPGS